MYDSSAKDTPLTLDGLGNQALHNLHVSVGAKASFVRSFVDSAEVVGLLTRLDAERVELRANPDNITPTNEEDVSSSTSAIIAASPAKPVATQPTINQTWQIDGGNITFTVTATSPLAGTSFTQLGTIMTSIEALAKTLTKESDNE